MRNQSLAITNTASTDDRGLVMVHSKLVANPSVCFGFYVKLFLAEMSQSTPCSMFESLENLLPYFVHSNK